MNMTPATSLAKSPATSPVKRTKTPMIKMRIAAVLDIGLTLTDNRCRPDKGGLNGCVQWVGLRFQEALETLGSLFFVLQKFVEPVLVSLSWGERVAADAAGHSLARLSKFEASTFRALHLVVLTLHI